MQNLRLRSLSAIILAISVSYGCSHTVDITARTSGVSGSTKVPGGSNSGLFSINLGQKTFTGRWVFASEGGGVTLSSGQAFSGAQTATFSGTGITLPGGGNGSVIASAPDGTGLRCQFNYSSMSETGLGICQDSLGEMYDLQIH